MNKAAEAFRTIGEVADDLDVPKHVLRFWEGKFPQIRPMKRGGGRRYYRPEDMELLRGIRHLLHAEGYTIKGVQKILREQGIEQVKALSRAAMSPAGSSKRAQRKQVSDTKAPAAGASELDGAQAHLRQAQQRRDLASRDPQTRSPNTAPVHDAKSRSPKQSAQHGAMHTAQIIQNAIKELEHCRAMLAPAHATEQSAQQAAEPKRARAGGRT